ncbi:TIGR03986 family type III CRISPR-associated RAMP protein [Calditrichota bacterium LG25]
MEKTILKRWISKSGNKVAAIVINNQPYVLTGFSDESFELDTEYEVEYREEYPAGKKKNRRLLVFYQGKLIYDSRPDLAESAEEEEIAPPEDTSPSGKKEKKPTSRSGVTLTKKHPGSGTVDGHVKPVSPKRAARAPYNFVPLNDTVFTVGKKDIPEFDCYHPDRFTGWIDLEIEAKTPLYIRDTLNHDEAKREFERQGKKKLPDDDNADFFSPNGEPQIAGSSLRGMVRTLVEIIGYGKFQFFDNRNLYFRALADMSNLRYEYLKRMSSFDRKLKRPVYKVLAGELCHVGLNFKIISSERNYKQILKSQARQKVEQIGKKYQEFKFYELPGEGYLVVSGPMKNKKRDWIIDFPKANAHEITLLEEDVNSYRNDATRSDEVPNLIELLEKGRYKKVPCFYVTWEDEDGKLRVSFGHTGMFRLAYKKAIEDHVPEVLRTLNNIDLVEAIFGRLTPESGANFAGRVFFEDAFLAEGQENVLMETAYPKILSTPKPTTFQHYLVQKDEDNRNLNHYDTDTQIRGYKLYWHKSGKNWVETDNAAIQKHRTQYTRITPVKPGTRFMGRIRFENLSKVELGALLYALDLPDGCYHKLGMGKPLGLGSVKMRPTLYISNRVERYKKLFAGWLEQPSAEANIEDFKVSFARNLSRQILGAEMDSLWDIPRLQELKVLLDYKNGVELEEKGETRYMEILGENEFKFRRVLPTASQVAGVGGDTTMLKKNFPHKRS